jgi:RNA polymerase sigma factor (sigma-70 family)
MVQPDDVSMCLGDEELVARVRASDEAAFARLFHTQYAALAEFARSFVHDAAGARELVGDVFVRLWEHRAQWVCTSSVRAYLYAAVANGARNAIRDAQREQLRRERSASGVSDVPPWMSGPREAPDRLAELHETSARLWRAVNALPDDDRIVLLLRWRYEMDYDEIAASGAAQRRQSRALARLRATLPGVFGPDD